MRADAKKRVLGMPFSANAHPVCRYDHRFTDGLHVCPAHGCPVKFTYRHQGALEIHACPQRGCEYTHTQPKGIRMTSPADTRTAALAIRDGQGYWDERQLAALQQLGIKDCTRADLQVFMHYCQRTGLDPFSRQIYMISRKTRDGAKQTIQVGIDGLRVIAARAAKRDGVSLSYGPTKWYDEDGNEYPYWVRREPPAAASVTIYRDNKPFPGFARFASFAATDRDGKYTGLWPSMGDHLIAKCAEAQALRRAFPHDLEGLHITDEGGHTERVPIAHREPRDEVPYSQPPAPAIQGPATKGDSERLRAAIEASFAQMSIDDEDERKNYLYKLANKPHGAELDEGDLRFAADSLRDCEGDRGALIDLCAVEAS